jgi:hypothetical protein
MDPFDYPPAGVHSESEITLPGTGKGPYRGLKTTYHGLRTFWVGLSSILSPCAALLVENAGIAYFGVDLSVWSRRAIKLGNGVSFDV